MRYFKSEPYHSTSNESKNKFKIGHMLSINPKIYSYRHRNSASSYIAWLQAIYYCVETILATSQIPSTSPFMIVSDFLASVSAVIYPYSSHPLVIRI